jgi:hypothetical protein
VLENVLSVWRHLVVELLGIVDTKSLFHSLTRIRQFSTCEIGLVSLVIAGKPPSSAPAFD